MFFVFFCVCVCVFFVFFFFVFFVCVCVCVCVFVVFEPHTIHMPYLHIICIQSSLVVVDSVCTDVTRHAR